MPEDAVVNGRRRFMRAALACTGTLPVAGLLAPGLTFAAAKPKLDPASERAGQFAYTPDAAQADDARREAGARCANCTHFRGNPDDAWAACNIFPEHRVNAGGWCSAWFSAG